MSARSVPASRPAAPSWPGPTLVGLLVLAIWSGTLAWMAGRWSEENGYFLHGFAVPPAAAWLAWYRRRDARWGEASQGGRHVPIGLALFGLASLIQAPSALLEIHFTSAVALVVAVMGFVLLFGGPSAFRTWLPALLFLGFMVPLPLAAVARANLELKLLAAGAALGPARALGVVVVRDGASLALEGGDVLVVGTVCSGLRFLVSLTALGAFVALASQLPFVRRLVLFLCAFPIAFAANVLRIIALVLVADARGAAAVEGTVHDVSGWLLFAVALGALLGLESLLCRLPGSTPRGRV